MPYHSVDQLLGAFQDRDIWLFFALFLIGALYYVADNALAQLDEYHRANPGAKAMYESWKAAQPIKVAGKAYCREHQCVVDWCRGLHEET
ncbi:MAG TPA: hypothetical protein VFY43_04160 [Candidatus Limnocylindria bacterium]|nr:hypothetical protein [Candidatus Limnocylindria bacterium]